MYTLLNLSFDISFEYTSPFFRIFIKRHKKMTLGKASIRLFLIVGFLPHLKHLI